VSWRQIPLGYCVTEVKKKNSGGREDNLLSLSYGNIVRRDIATADGLLPESFDSYNVVFNGDTVLRLTDLQNDQRSLRVGLVEEVGIITSAYVTIRPRKDLHPKFLNYFLKHMDFRKDFYALGAGVRQSLKFDELRSVKIPVPSFSEQKAIADYLDSETARIDTLVKKKTQLIESLGQKWINELRESVETQPNAEILQLRRCIEKVVSGNWGSEPGTADQDLLCIRAGDFDFRNYVANRGVMRGYSSDDIEKSRLRKGDLIIEKSGGGEESPVGRVVEWKSDELAIPTNFAAGVRVNKRVSRKYLLYVFAMCYASRLTTRSIKQTTGIQNLDMGSYLSEKVPVPSLEIQDLIVKKLDNALADIRITQDRLAVQIDLLRERRQAMISSAVTGELEIPEVAA
jgi:type I restriction enzyme S subunit